MNIIEASHLSKSFGDIQALKDMSFHVEKGELFGFLGVNGAGKSTTIRILTTLFSPSSGHASVCGLALGKQNKEIRKHIGIVSQQNCLDDKLSVEENLQLYGALQETKTSIVQQQIKEVAVLLHIEDILSRRFAKLSGGQKRRCEIAKALLHTPDILFLDEPTTGLDPASRTAVWQCMEQLQKKRGMTIFLTTHYMEEAAKATHIAVIDHGRLLEYGTPYQLKETYAKDRLLISAKDQHQLCSLLTARGISYTIQEQRIQIEVPNTRHAIDILQAVRDVVDSFEVWQGTMDDVFLNISKKSQKEDGR